MMDLLRDDIVSGHVGHAYLIYGDEAALEKEGAAFAQALNCLSPREGEACGTCRHCVQFQAGNFSDLAVLEPAKTNYVKDQIVELLKYTPLTAKSGGFRIFWLKKADHLTEECADRLLKTLAEPVENTVFLLTAENDDRIAETIASRCRILRLRSGYRRDDSRREEIFQLLCLVKKEPMEYLFRAAEKYAVDKNKEEAASFFETAASLLADNYYARRGGEEADLVFPASLWSEEDLFAAWQWAVSAPVLLNSAINLKLIVENFLLCIKRNGGLHGNCSWCTL